MCLQRVCRWPSQTFTLAEHTVSLFAEKNALRFSELLDSTWPHHIVVAIWGIVLWEACWLDPASLFLCDPVVVQWLEGSVLHCDVYIHIQKAEWRMVLVSEAIVLTLHNSVACIIIRVVSALMMTYFDIMCGPFFSRFFMKLMIIIDHHLGEDT